MGKAEGVQSPQILANWLPYHVIYQHNSRKGLSYKEYNLASVLHLSRLAPSMVENSSTLILEVYLRAVRNTNTASFSRKSLLGFLCTS